MDDNTKAVIKLEEKCRIMDEKIANIESTLKDFPKMEYIINMIQKSFEEQNKINKETVEAITKVNTSLVQLVMTQSEQTQSIENLNKKVSELDAKNKIDITEVRNDNIKNLIKSILPWALAVLLATSNFVLK